MLGHFDFLIESTWGKCEFVRVEDEQVQQGLPGFTGASQFAIHNEHGKYKQ